MLPGIRQDNALVTAADDLEQTIKALFPGDPARAEEFLTALAQGSGSLASLLLGGVAIRGAATLLAKSGKLASRVGTAVVGSTSQAVEGFEEAERMGADALARYTAFFLNAGLGATEAIPIDRFFSRLNRVTDNRVAKLLQTTSAQSLEEFTQEVIESLGADVIAKAVFDVLRVNCLKASPRGKESARISLLLTLIATSNLPTNEEASTAMRKRIFSMQSIKRLARQALMQTT